MDEREKLMLEKLKPEKHISAMMTLATIISSMGEYSDNISVCRFCGEDNTPAEREEYDMTERKNK